MRGRWPPLVLLGGALVFLASLYLPWRTVQNGPASVDGWDAAPGYAAGLLAAALVVAAAVALLRPSYAARLPLGGLGVALGFFAIGVGLQLTEFSIPVGTYPGPGGWTGYGPIHWAWSYGVYLGGAGGGMAGLAALVLRREEMLFRRRSVAEDAAGLLALGLLVSFLLPWQKSPAITVIGLATAAAMIPAAALLLAAGRLSRLGPRDRLVCAVAVAVLTGAAASGTGISGALAYAAWMAIGFAVPLVALEAARARPQLQVTERPGGWTALRSGAAVLLLVALFLPWLSFGLAHGRTFATDGWQPVFGATAGALALLLLASPLWPWVATYALEAALGIALLVATFGVEVAWDANAPALSVGWRLRRLRGSRAPAARRSGARSMAARRPTEGCPARPAGDGFSRLCRRGRGSGLAGGVATGLDHQG